MSTMRTFCRDCYTWGGHAKGCPREEEPKPKYMCDQCLDGIQEGEEIAESDGAYLHKECLDDMTKKQLVEWMGGKMRTA